MPVKETKILTIIFINRISWAVLEKFLENFATNLSKLRIFMKNLKKFLKNTQKMIVQEYWRKHGIQTTVQSPIQPRSGPVRFLVVPNHERTLRNEQFTTNAQVISWMHVILNGLASEEFSDYPSQMGQTNGTLPCQPQSVLWKWAGNQRRCRERR